MLLLGIMMTAWDLWGREEKNHLWKVGSVANAEAKANANSNYLNLIQKQGIIIKNIYISSSIISFILVLFIWL